MVTMGIYWMRIIFIVCFLSPTLSYALEPDTANSDFSERLTQGLKELKKSVDQLSSSNETLALKNIQLKARFDDSQMVLQKLLEDNRKLMESSDKLHRNDPMRAKQIAQLQKDLMDLDNKLSGLEPQFKVAKNNITSGQKEDQRLNDQIKQGGMPVVANTDAISPEISQIWEQKQKEKMAILKLIMESQNRQELLREQISDFQKDVPVLASNSILLNRRKALEAQIQKVQQEIAQLNLNQNPSQQNLNEKQLQQLQVNISNLEKNRDELQGLLLKMQQKIQQIPLTEDQKLEQAKLQSNIDRLKKEAKGLKFDLGELQQQMVGLDKRKSDLEALLEK